MPAADRWLLPAGGAAPSAKTGTAPDNVLVPAGSAADGPWDRGCRVVPMISGHQALSALRDSLERAIVQAGWLPDRPPGQRGHVYLAYWTMTPQRDLSESNPWGLGPWKAGQPVRTDQTALGLVLRLMDAGILVRILLWYPRAVTDFIVGSAHIEDHLYMTRAVRAHNESLLQDRFAGCAQPLGVVGMDLRVAESVRPSTHQQPQLHEKLAIIRVGDIAEAHCGGVDLGFTRRDAPPMHGDWQSGSEIPEPAHRWPGWRHYRSLVALGPPGTGRRGDLPVEVYGDRRQIWHDQQLMLEGPVVATIEEGFRRRWTAPGRPLVLGSHTVRPESWQAGCVVFSTPQAVDTAVVPLPRVVPVASVGSSTVQVWRTRPWRGEASTGGAGAGEYTAMAGTCHASMQSSELIWIFDQYFWHRPLARLLNRLLSERAGLRVVIVLPPHAGGGNAASRTANMIHRVHHHARRLALDDLVEGLGPSHSSRVGVYDLWQPGRLGGRGVYCHAKAHTYDGDLLVCGSANLNWRSFTRDVETVAAVLDPAVVHQHQQALWRWLFRGAAWPIRDHGRDLRLDRPGAGVLFFDAFRREAAAPGSYVLPDRWNAGSHALPNGIMREVAEATDVELERLLLEVDPDALPWRGLAGPDGRPPTDGRMALDELVERLRTASVIDPG